MGRATALLSSEWGGGLAWPGLGLAAKAPWGSSVTPQDDLLLSLARASGFSRREVGRFLQLGIVTFTGEPVQPALLRRLRRVRRMRRDLGLSLDAIVIILRLLDRLEALEGRTPPAGTSITVLEDL
jgi:hypothetical protein